MKTSDLNTSQKQAMENNQPVLDKKDLRRLFWRSLPMEFSWHYERQMHMGFTHMISAGLEKIYKGQPEKLAEALQRNMEFFNITSHVSPFVGGITLAMEEVNSKEDNYDVSSINSVKAALMGPLSGIGDSLILGTLRILAVGIGASLSMQGNLLGPLMFLLVFNVPTYLLRWICAMKGYTLGASFLTKLQANGTMEKFMLGAAILGCIVIGGMTKELVSVTTPIMLGSGEGASSLQSIFDSLMPGLLGLGVTGVYYWLLQKKVNVIWSFIGTALVGIAASWLHILG